MDCTRIRSQAFVDQSAVAAARDAFLSSGAESPDVRAETLRAWKRSLAAGAEVAARPPRLGPESTNFDTALLRAVKPVATAMMRRLGTADFAMVVTDKQACVAGRWVTNRSIATLLDGLGTVVGASFDEAHVGSTGLGTVLEDRAISIVDGAEHLNHHFDPVLAVGAPIIHPATGHTEGALDLVCPTGIRPETLVALVEHAAREVGAGLLSGYAAQDRALLDAFLRLERRGPRRPVLALNRRIMITNPRAGILLRGYTHDLLWRDIEAAFTVGSTSAELITEAGRSLEANIRPIIVDGSACGAVLQLCDSQRAGASRPIGPACDAADDIANHLQRRWRGNIRHLQRVPGAMVSNAGRVRTRREDLLTEFGSATPHARLTYLQNVERNVIAELLSSTGGNKRQVADILGVSRATLYRKLAALHLA